MAALAARSLRDATVWFYTLFGNAGGRFQGMDMDRYLAFRSAIHADARQPEHRSSQKVHQAAGMRLDFGCVLINR
ncbi:MAG: hypothetical protein ACJAZO_002269 [Myxococcota bacterium]